MFLSLEPGARRKRTPLEAPNSSRGFLFLEEEDYYVH